MTLRSLGRTGIKVSTLCLGGDNFLNPTSEEESIRMIDAALAVARGSVVHGSIPRA
jgi:aryl-alcohol dehydrogenase-like predicted oxidoreductase